MKTETRILDNRLYYTRKIELHKKSRTVQITPILICLVQQNLSVLITVRRVHYGEMGKAPTTMGKGNLMMRCIMLKDQKLPDDTSQFTSLVMAIRALDRSIYSDD